MGRLARGFVCGAAAAAVWAAAEPALRRVTRTEYSDVRLVGDPLSKDSQLPGLAVHCLNGGMFGAAFTGSACRACARGSWSPSSRAPACGR